MGMCIIIPNVIYKIGELNNEESGRTFNMTVMELRVYNSLSNEEIKQAAEMFEYDEHERDPLTLLSST